MRENLNNARWVALIAAAAVVAGCRLTETIAAQPPPSPIEPPKQVVVPRDLVRADGRLAPTVVPIAYGLNIHANPGATVTWWDELWLKEGFATWAELSGFASRLDWQAYLAIQARNTTIGHDLANVARAMVRPIQSVAQARAAYDVNAYQKGMLVYRMLEAHLGTEQLHAVLRRFFARHRFGEVTTKDLLASLRTTDSNAALIVRDYVSQPGMPVVDAALQCRPGQPPRIALRQQRFVPEGDRDATDVATWHVPVCITWGRAGSRPGQDCRLLTKREERLQLATDECPEWGLLNANGTGHYVFRQPHDARQALHDRGLEELSDPLVEAAAVARSCASFAAAQSASLDRYLGRFSKTPPTRTAW